MCRQSVALGSRPTLLMLDVSVQSRNGTGDVVRWGRLHWTRGQITVGGQIEEGDRTQGRQGGWSWPDRVSKKCPQSIHLLQLTSLPLTYVQICVIILCVVSNKPAICQSYLI